ncbi:uncharacterized protein LOC117182944 [Belonocnema kinseyi]|uniref:uncharacterized protein LOC117182944 n=1 Tax=Belonocnema kinseyi TaxID=2817044 RepID=UPI00143DD7E8|nr:uncharacterized protein LOC117182944 [Belonocnema kinseyi]
MRSLSELPLDKLIQIRSTFADEINEADGNLTVSSRMGGFLLPSALPLKRNSNKPIRRYEEWDDKGKDTKISKIFQLVITALSFLAFGGYLLTLIIMACKRAVPPPTASSFIVLSDLKNLQKIKRPKRNIFVFDPMENEFDTDRIYRGMIMLSRGYALYNK